MATPFDPARAEVSNAFARNLWFRRQPHRLQEALSAAAISVHAEAGRRLYEAGDDAYGLYGVISGTVNIYVQMPDGEYALSNIVGPGTIFGYAGRLVGKRRLVSAVVRNEARLFYIAEARIETIARAQPDLWLHFAELASEQLVAATRGMVTNARGAPSDRVAMYLSGMSGDAPEGSAPVRLTQEELAELTGLSRKTVNRVLKDLTEKGVIETGYGQIRMINGTAFSNQ
ncbi:MAG: Crp/Fnr family transcriptional regulator [Parvibaculum sp.]|nr:Crp/Fnr family transcriptional regulator [Parvibaculum sp.]|tara:strand:- start:928 stop:1614 length:687 start_codon:yes stop_codon:yes gene_type:complete